MDFCRTYFYSHRTQNVESTGNITFAPSKELRFYGFHGTGFHDTHNFSMACGNCISPVSVKKYKNRVSKSIYFPK